MAALSGRDLIVKKGATVIGGVKTTSLSVDNSMVDITSKDSDGFRTLASFAGTRAMTISLDGIWDDDLLSAVALGTDSALLTDITIESKSLTDGATTGTLSGDFYLASYEISGSDAEAITHTATLESSGAWEIA